MCVIDQIKQKIIEKIAEISAKRPIFEFLDESENLIIECYSIEIENLIEMNKIIEEVVNHQKKKENEVKLLELKKKKLIDDSKILIVILFIKNSI